MAFTKKMSLPKKFKDFWFPRVEPRKLSSGAFEDSKGMTTKRTWLDRIGDNYSEIIFMRQERIYNKSFSPIQITWTKWLKNEFSGLKILRNNIAFNRSRLYFL